MATATKKTPTRRQRKNSMIKAFWRQSLPVLLQSIVEGEKRAAAVNPDFRPQPTGQDKLEFAVEWLNSRIDIPIAPEWMEETLFRMALTLLIEFLKMQFGKDEWYQALEQMLA